MGTRGTDLGSAMKLELWLWVLVLGDSRCGWVDVQREHLVDVGEVHLQAVLVFVGLQRHGLHAPFALYAHYEWHVYREIADWCRVCVAGSCGCAVEVVVVGWAEEEDALSVAVVSIQDMKVYNDGRPTLSPSQHSCRPMLLQAPSTSNRRACTS
jgi:hypothetical protein